MVCALCARGADLSGSRIALTGRRALCRRLVPTARKDDGRKHNCEREGKACAHALILTDQTCR